jgi:hypothetical protein
LDASSVQTDPEEPCRIVWMINGMIKYLDSSSAGEAEESWQRSDPSTFR